MSIKLSKRKVSQTIDLSDIGIDIRDNQAARLAIAQGIIDRIVERTEDGQAVVIKDGQAFARKGGKLKSPYSKSYSETDLFKAFGKSRTNVNMTLTGDMLGTLDVISSRGNRIELGWDDPTQNAKAFNHNVGDTVPKRSFFGITRNELKEIAESVLGDTPTTEVESESRSTANEIILQILKDLEVG